MVLKYLTNRENNERVSFDQWNFIDGIIGASVYYDPEVNMTVAELEFEVRPSITIALQAEAYLLNENGKTIERVGV